MQVIYSSATGNTKKLAQAIAHELNSEAFAAENVSALENCVALGFWCDKGQIDEAAMGVLHRLRGKQVALFYSAGVEKEHEYVAQMSEQFAQTARDMGISVIADVFMSQGAISDEVIKHFKQLHAQDPAKYPITEEKQARWAESKNHPDGDDLERARAWAAGLEAASKQLQNALEHMKSDHASSVEDVAAAKGLEPSGAELVALDYAGMGIQAAGEYIWVPYETKPAEAKDLHMSVVEVCVNAKKQPNASALQEQMLQFRRGFKSAVIASVRPDGHALASYAPVIEHDGCLYAFISEVADHYAALSANENASIMFVEDEAAAAMIFARKRLRYEVRAQILPREESALEEALFGALAAMSGGSVGMFRAMQDFHFVRLDIKGGRFVKGFGAAFDVDASGKVAPARVNNPHRKK